MKRIEKRMVWITIMVLALWPVSGPAFIVTVDPVGDAGHFASMAVVNGNPAVSYLDNSNNVLKYVRANDADGTTWGTPVTIDSVGIIGRGRPRQWSIGTRRAPIRWNNNDLKYVRALDADGTSWGTPVTVDLLGAPGQFVSLAGVNGHPAMRNRQTPPRKPSSARNSSSTLV